MTMRERIARVIYDQLEGPVANQDAGRQRRQWLFAQDIAVVVLDAMAEPTAEMHEAARDWSCVKYGKPIGTDASAGCWRSMIEAAKP